ncbi:MAG: ribosome maturation factor RimP [Coriobacteriaceae bacterium]|nr:ribosome maturation factor RimP [Coriobacteriaceae bacterium]
MATKKVQTLIEALEPIADSHDFELVDIEVIAQGSSPIIRVYIDRAKGLDIDSITAANVWIGEEIERIDPFSGTYTLEVSSPGIDRPLRIPEHFNRYAGEMAILQTELLEGRRKWTGTLRGMDGDDVLVEVDGRIERLAFSAIKKARIKGRIDFKVRKDA